MRIMKVGCACIFISVCGAFAFTAQLIGIIIPKVVVIEIELHGDEDITLDKFIEKVQKELEDEDSEEDDVYEIAFRKRSKLENHPENEHAGIDVFSDRNNNRINLEQTLSSISKERNPSQDMTVITHDSLTNIPVTYTEAGKLESVTDASLTDARNEHTDKAKSAVCESSSSSSDNLEESSSSSSDEDETGNDEEDESEPEVDYENVELEEDDDNNDEDEIDKDRKGDRSEVVDAGKNEDPDEDADTNSCSEESNEQDITNNATTFRSLSSLNIGLWSTFLCADVGANRTECVSMAVTDALNYRKKDAGFKNAGLDVSLWDTVRIESIFSLACCVLGLVCLGISVAQYCRTRPLLPHVFGSIAFVSTGILTLVPVTRILIVTFDMFNNKSQRKHLYSFGFPWSILAFCVCGVLSMMAAFVWISVTWYSRKQKWRLLLKRTRYLDAEVVERLKDKHVEKIYAELERRPGSLDDIRYTRVDVHRARDQNDSHFPMLGTHRVETIEVEMTDLGERETFV